MVSRIKDIYELAKNKPKKRLILVAANDDNALEALANAVRLNIVDPILIGNTDEIKKTAEENSISIKGMTIIHESDNENAAIRAANMIHNKEADIIMKGKLPTAAMAHALLNKKYRFSTGRRLSHLALFELENYHKLIGLTDGAINIAPNIKQKKDIIINAVDFFNKLGNTNPKVAVLTAIETINKDMIATTDAAALKQMWLNGDIKKCILEGPISFDIAISKGSASHKNITSEVAGDADILVTHAIEVANALYKSFIFLANGRCANVMLGATIPIVITSRSDSDDTKLNSIVLASAIDF